MSWEFKSPKAHRKPRARAKAAYRGMKQRCGNANGRNPAYASVELRMTEEEWLEWALPLYEAFLEDDPTGSPCVSRKDDVGNYELGNLEIVSFKENRKRQRMKKPAAEVHGTLASYRYCRCEICRKAHSEYMKAYRARKKT